MSSNFRRVFALQSALAAVMGLLLTGLISAATAAEPAVGEPPHFIRVDSKNSLIHLGSLDSFDISEDGIKAAKGIFGYLTSKNPAGLEDALKTYELIIPKENFGGEYTALQWLCEFFLASPAEQHKLLGDRLVNEWYQYLAGKDFAALKLYLKQKYHLDEYKDKKTPKLTGEYRFMEDFLLFNNPRRERWEKTSKIIDVLGLKKGDVVADVGCGPGYYTFKFADIVGPTGFVYGLDNNPRHIEYLEKLIAKFGTKNVQAVKARPTLVEAGRKADLIYLCSVYHILYTTYDEEERTTFLTSVKKLLKPGGRVVVVDNALVADRKLPYHGPYIARELVINQFWYHGFRLVAQHQFIPQRYVLIFELAAGGEPPPATLSQALPADCIPILQKTSLVRCLKGGTSPGFSPEGRVAARLFRAALESKRPKDLRQALALYEVLVPRERFGDEYTAFQWFCEYLLAGPRRQHEMLAADPIIPDYFARLSADDYKILKTYLRVKYFLDKKLPGDDDEQLQLNSAAILKSYGRVKDYLEKTLPGKKDKKQSGAKSKDNPDDMPEPSELEITDTGGLTLDQINEWGDFIAFNNPNRERWEKTSRVLDFLHIKPGDSVVDLGCGPGYYTYKFSRLVGPEGRVFAVDTLRSQLDYVGGVCKAHGMRNVRPVLARDNDMHVPPESADLIYICSMYHAMYVTSLEYVKDGFIASIRRCLRKGGRLVIADNDIMPGTELGYYGPRIARELIITQLKHYGFRLVDSAQFIPQRYVLVFQAE